MRNAVPLTIIAAVGGLLAWNIYHVTPGKDGPNAVPVVPSPPVFAGYVVVCTQPACPPCDLLKANLKSVQGIDIRYVDVSTRAGRKQYPVKATPTVIRCLTSGKETGRKEGVMSAAEFVSWVNSGPTSTPVRDLEQGDIE